MEDRSSWYCSNQTNWAKCSTQPRPENRTEPGWYVTVGLAENKVPPRTMLLMLLSMFAAVTAGTYYLCSFPVTLGLMGANTLAFFMLRRNLWQLTELASSCRLSLKQRQFYRLVTSAFAHREALHFFINMMSLFNLGSLVERMLGPVKFLACYVFIMLAGGTISVLLHWRKMPNQMSIGASGAVCGLLGIVLIYALYYGALGVVRAILPALMMLVLMLHSSRIDNTGHFCGLGTGIAVGVVLIEWPLWMTMLGI